MAFSFTGLAFLFGFFAMGLLSYRLFQSWQREKTVISKLFFYFAAIFSLFFLIAAITGLLFAKNPTVLRARVITGAFIQTMAFANLGYLIFYTKLPQISPWFGFISVFLLGLVAAILTIVIPFEPFLEPSGGINWGSQPPADILKVLIYLITCLPLAIIFFQQFRTSKDPSVRAKAIGLSFAFMFGLIVGLFDFLLENLLKLGAISSDVSLSFFSIILLIIIFFTQKPPPPEKKVSFTPRS